MNHKKVFLRMLKDFGCYHGFLENFKKHKRYVDEFNKVADKSLDNFIKLSLKRTETRRFGSSTEFYYFINDVFDWGKTKERFDFWSNIARKMKCAGRQIHDTSECCDEIIYSQDEVKSLRKLLYGKEI